MKDLHILIVKITDEQHKHLKKNALETNSSIPEMVRCLIDNDIYDEENEGEYSYEDIKQSIDNPFK